MKRIKLFEEFVNEGIHDPGILKAYFMAGGPGSGKSYVVNTVFGMSGSITSSLSTSTGLKLINSDNAFELQLQKMGYDAKKLADYSQDPELWDEIMNVRDRAKRITHSRMNHYINGRLGMIIDGTGKDYDKITGWATMLKDWGYDVHMIFVNTSEEVAQQRNLNRERTLAPEMVSKMWHDVQNNIGKFQAFFKKNFYIVDNSGSDSNTVADSERIIIRSVKKEVQNPVGKKWLKEMQVLGKNQPF